MYRYVLEYRGYTETSINACTPLRDGSPGAVVKAVCVEKSEIAGSYHALAFRLKKKFLPRSFVKIQYCGEPP